MSCRFLRLRLFAAVADAPMMLRFNADTFIFCAPREDAAMPRCRCRACCHFACLCRAR